MRSALILLIVLGFFSCNESKDSENYIYRFDGAILGLDEEPFERAQLLKLDIFEYCIIDCEDGIKISREFFTDAQGKFDFEITTELNLTDLIYNIYPLDDEDSYFVKVNASSEIGGYVTNENYDEIVVAFASKLKVKIKNEDTTAKSLRLVVNRCLDSSPTLGCFGETFNFGSLKKDTTLNFSFPYELTPYVEIFWNDLNENLSGSETIQLFGNFDHQLEIVL